MDNTNMALLCLTFLATVWFALGNNSWAFTFVTGVFALYINPDTVKKKIKTLVSA